MSSVHEADKILIQFKTVNPDCTEY